LRTVLIAFCTMTRLFISQGNAAA